MFSLNIHSSNKHYLPKDFFVLLNDGRPDDAPAPDVSGAFLVALPNSTALTRAAKFREQKVSSALNETGLIQTNISVLLSFDRES